MSKNKTILMYHSISANGANNGEIGAKLYSISKNSFREQMQYISQCGIDNFIITFDDGDASNYKYAYPILKDMGIRACFFVIVSRIGQRGYMKWEQIKELRDNGMVIGSHGMNHNILSGLKNGELDYELGASKRFIEDNLGHHIDYFSIPRGFYNNKVISKARQFGYKRVFTSDIKDTGSYKFGRIPVKGDWDLPYFIRVVNKGQSLKHRTEEFVKTSSKKVLGAKNYDRLRSLVLNK